MRIEGSSFPVQAVLGALTRSPGGFALPGTSRADPPPPSAPSLAAATSVQVLVAAAAANAIESPGERRRRIARPLARGLDLLDQLDVAAQRGLPDPPTLDALEAWAQDFTLPEDAELAPLARDVELRVRVELARHDRTV